MVAGVVEEEEGARAGVEQARNRKRSAGCGRHPLLERLRLDGGLAVERERAGVESGGRDVLGQVAAHLIAASASSAEAAGSAEPAESSAVAAASAATATRAAAPTTA